MPLSVIIPVYNSAHVLPRALASLTEAGRQGVEVVVVDDGSSDDTVDVTHRWQEFPLKVLVQENAGPGAARNRGLSAARGRYVCFLDSDDEVSPGWYSFFSRLSATSPWVMATCGVELRYGDGRVERRTPRRMGPAYCGMTASFLPGSYAIERELVQRRGGFSGTPYGEHHELALRLAPDLAQAPVLVTEDLLLVKHHDRGASRVRSYDRARLAGSEYVLEHHARALAGDHVMRADYHAVAAHAALALGQKRRAVSHVVSALRAQPTRPKHWARLARALL